MPKLEYFLVAESISVDRDLNQVSVFNILEEVYFPKSDHWVIPKLVACSSWIFEPENQNKDYQVQLEITQPGQECNDLPKQYSMNFTTKGARQRVYLRYEGLSVEREGDILFNLSLNGEHQATHVLTVRQSDEQVD